MERVFKRKIYEKLLEWKEQTILCIPAYIALLIM